MSGPLPPQAPGESQAAATIDAVQSAARDALGRAGVSCVDPVIVACSGGADSAVLADVAMELASGGELGPVTLVYVDHGLRPNTAADAAVVEALAEIGGGSARVVTVEVDRSEASLENAARRVRYEALERVADEIGARWILTAHTASDQAETVLLRIVRGAGITGLAGIPHRRGQILRPLLEVPRSLIDTYREVRDVAAIEDPTNLTPAFTRNRMRHDLLPRLRAENPRLDEALCRLAGAAREQRDALEYAADQLLIRAAASDRRLDVRELVSAPAVVVKRALARAAEAAGGEPLEARHLEAVLRMVRRPRKGTIQLDLPGLTAVREYDVLVLRPPGTMALPPLRQVSVHGPQPPYQIRRWREGDRMRPIRLKGRSRKLSDLYGDARVPREVRPLALVVARERDGAIEWAEHLGLAWQSEVQVTLSCPNG